MASDVTLHLAKQYLATDAIILEAGHMESIPKDEIERFGADEYPGELMVFIHADTGELLGVTVELFTTETADAVKALRENPVHWTVTIPDEGIKEKPLDDALETLFRRYKDTKMEWE